MDGCARPVAWTLEKGKLGDDGGRSTRRYDLRTVQLTELQEDGDNVVEYTTSEREFCIDIGVRRPVCLKT